MVLKTQPNDGDVLAFLGRVPDERKRADCQIILDLMKKVTRQKPVMWGTSIVGFGNRHYRYESGREGDWFVVGFSPRKQNIVLYLMPGLMQHKALIAKLGKVKAGGGCLYIKRLEDVDLPMLRTLVKQSIDHAAKKK